MAKCILLIRVSTPQQDYTAQKNDLIKFATDQYKYDEKDLIFVENVESAIKLDEEQRQGIASMKEYIENDKSIDCVFVWETSRLGRRYDVIEGVRDFLIKHHVNLRFYKEGLQLLNSDGGINHYGNLIMDVSMALAKNEMETKIARLNREKLQKTRDGKTPTGRILFGYRIDDNGYVRIDEEKAQIVRDIFNWSASGKSTLWIWDECFSRGYFTYKPRTRGKAYICSILNQPAYCGRKGYRTNTKYDAIVTKDLFDKAKEAKSIRRNSSKSVSKYVAFGKGIVRFKFEDGKEYAMNVGHSRSTYRTQKPDMKINVTINMNIIDHILWSESVHLYTQYLTKQGQEAKEQLLLEKGVIEKKITSQEDVIKKIKTQKERRGVRYEMEEISREDYEDGIKQLNNILKKENERLNNYIVTLSKIENQLNNLGKDEWALINSNNIEGITDDNHKKEIIDKVIENIIVSHIGKTENNDTIYKIEINQKVNMLYNRFFTYWTRGGVFHLFLHIINPFDDSERVIDISKNIVRRFPSDWSIRQKRSEDESVVAPPTIVDD